MRQSRNKATALNFILYAACRRGNGIAIRHSGDSHLLDRGFNHAAMARSGKGFSSPFTLPTSHFPSPPVNRMPFFRKKGKIDNRRHTNADDITDHKAKEQRDTAPIERNPTNAQNNELGRPGQKNTESINPRPRHLLKSQTQGMQGPPRDAIAKEHKQTRLPKSKNPDRYFTRIKNRFIRTDNSGNHAIIRANIGPAKTRQPQVLTRVIISQMHNKKT